MCVWINALIIPIIIHTYIHTYIHIFGKILLNENEVKVKKGENEPELKFFKFYEQFTIRIFLFYIKW